MFIKLTSYSSSLLSINLIICRSLPWVPRTRLTPLTFPISSRAQPALYSYYIYNWPQLVVTILVLESMASTWISLYRSNLLCSSLILLSFSIFSFFNFIFNISLRVSLYWKMAVWPTACCKELKLPHIPICPYWFIFGFYPSWPDSITFV